MDLPPSNSGLASTPKAAVLQRKESFATPRSAVTHNGVRIATGLPGSSTKRLSAAFKSPMRQTDRAPADAETMDSLLQDIKSLEQKDAQIADEIDLLHRQGCSEDELKEHIECLHAYNEMKDIGQMLLGQLAVRQRVTTKELYAIYGLELDD